MPHSEQIVDEVSKRLSQKNALTLKLINMRPMITKDRTSWRMFKTQDHLMQTQAIISYSERWARLMQAEMISGKELLDVIKDTSNEANYGNLNCQQYREAFGILVKYWTYGDKLNKWANKPQVAE